MASEKLKNWLPLVVGLSILLVLISVKFFAVKKLCDGNFIYSLDDPYIHLSLAQNIQKGNYGINNGEPSSPSSSIIWPFLLVLFSSNVYAPFFINIIATIFIVYFIDKILAISIKIEDKRKSIIVNSTLLTLIILCSNLIGIIFTGMEHSLQVLSVVLIVYGLILESEDKNVSNWFLILIIIAPLIRYENMAISIPVIVYLATSGYLVKAAATFVIIISELSIFSIYLKSLGLPWLPSSIIVKTAGGDGKSILSIIMSNLYDSFTDRQGLILVACAFACLCVVLFDKQNPKRKLLIMTLFSLVLHFVAGHYNWLHRYEIYIWIYLLLIVVYVWGKFIPTLLTEPYSERNLFKLIVVFFIFFGITGLEYFNNLKMLPIVSSKIYNQQYQMHRFIVDYYKKPVAVNDIGFTSFDNDNYVLDLWGLASQQAFRARMKDLTGAWLDTICNEKNVKLVMIYPQHFRRIPTQWVKLGKLVIKKNGPSDIHDSVTFYSTKKIFSHKIIKLLHEFSKTLPSKSYFSFNTI